MTQLPTIGFCLTEGGAQVQLKTVTPKKIGDQQVKFTIICKLITNRTVRSMPQNVGDKGP